MAIQQLILDLSGKAGLSKGHAGSDDMVTVQPNLIRSVEGNEIASGLFNQYLREGYLAPVSTTFATVTNDVTPSSKFIASEYDQVEGRAYWADDTNHIYLGSDLNDISLINTLTLEGVSIANFPDRKIENLYDLQLYQINGVRKLFFSGKGLSYGGVNDLQIATQATSSKYMTLTASVVPTGTTKPAVIGQARQFVGTGANSSTAYTLVAGTDTVLWCMVFTDGANNIANAFWRDSSGTPSYPMTELTSGTTGTQKCKLFALASPASVGSGEVRVTMSASGVAYLVYVFQTNNTDQTNLGDGNPKAATTTTATQNILFQAGVFNKNQLEVIGFYGAVGSDPTEFAQFFDDYVFSVNSQAYGRDFLSKTNDNVPRYGLQVGYTNLNLTTSGVEKETWMASLSQTPFTTDIPGNFAFLRTADNGFCYVFASNAVHKIDGSTIGGEFGISTKNVLLFPEYFRITDAIDFRSRLYIAVHNYPVTVQDTNLNNYRGGCGIYVWNRVSTQLSAADFIELPGVREIKKIYSSPDGVIKLITISESGLTELRQFGYNDSGGVVFPTKITMGIGAAPQYPDSFATAGDKVLWLANNGYVYSEKENAISKLFETSAPGATSALLANNIESGAILYGSGLETADSGFRSNKQGVFLSYEISNVITNKKIYPFDLKTGSNGSQTPHQGDVFTGVSFIPVTSVLRGVRVYNAPITGTGSGVVATVKLYFNQSSTVSMTKTITKDEAKRGYVDFHINKPYIHAIQVEIEWNTAEPIGADMYLPSVAVVSYEDTTTKSPDNG